MKRLQLLIILFLPLIWAQPPAFDPNDFQIEAFDTVPHPEGVVPAGLLPMPPECMKAIALDEEQSAAFRVALDRAKELKPPALAKQRALVELKRLLKPEQVASCRAWYKSAKMRCPLDEDEAPVRPLLR